MHVPAVVDRNAWLPIVMPVVMMAVVRMSPIARVMYLQVMVRPADVKGGRDAPEVSGGKGMAIRIRVVVERVRVRIVEINTPAWLIDDYFFRLVVRHVDDLFIDRINRDAAIVIGDRLIFVSLQVAGGICAVAKRLNGRNDISLLTNDGFAEAPGPVDILVHHADHLGIVQQRHH